MNRLPAGRFLALPGLAFVVAGASCALRFTDYELDEGMTSASSSVTTGAGGEGGGDPSLAPDGMPCTADEECRNNHCLPSNTGLGNVCCVIDCPDMGPSSCATNGKCDAQGGSCALYASGTICGSTATCLDGQLTSMQCQLGSCEHVLGPCPGGLVCKDASSCKTECMSPADCIQPNAGCPDKECVQPAGSICDSNEQCMSGICGTTGVGHCCSAACNAPTDEECGATDCDDAGVCQFPTTACGSDPSCMGSTLTSEYCNGFGVCGGAREDRPCPGSLRCDDALSCHATCGSNDSTGDDLCVPGFWCDGASCVPAAGLSAPCTRATQCVSGICVTLFGRCL